MARTKRDDLKRDIAQAVHHMDVSIANVLEVWKEFHAADNPMTSGLDTIISTQTEIKHALLGFALAAWNLDEEGLARYRE